MKRICFHFIAKYNLREDVYLLFFDIISTIFDKQRKRMDLKGKRDRAFALPRIDIYFINWTSRSDD